MEYQLTYQQIRFCHTDAPTFEEREIHAYHEILYCMDSSADLFTEDCRQKVKKDTLILIPRGQYHLLQIRPGAGFSRLKISFPPEGEGEAFGFPSQIRIIEQPAGAIPLLLEQILTALHRNAPDSTARLQAYGAFLLLLGALGTPQSSPPVNSRDSHHLISRCLTYIHAHLSDKLTLETVAKALFVSPSSLSHSFKEEMGISFHQYITQKRLAQAQSMLLQGQDPTRIYSICGYGDYSAFFRAYKKMFGTTPSAKNLPGSR